MRVIDRPGASAIASRLLDLGIRCRFGLWLWSELRLPEVIRCLRLQPELNCTGLMRTTTKSYTRPWNSGDFRVKSRVTTGSRITCQLRNTPLQEPEHVAKCSNWRR